HRAQLGEGGIAHALVEAADGAEQFHRIGDDVVAHATVDAAEGQHHRQPGDVLAAGDDLLRVHDDGAGGEHRVDPAPGPRAVGLAPVHHDLEAVGSGHHRPAAVTDVADVQRCPDMQPERHVRP